MPNKSNQKAVEAAMETLTDIVELQFEKDNAAAKTDEINEHNKEISELTAKSLKLFLAKRLMWL